MRRSGDKNKYSCILKQQYQFHHIIWIMAGSGLRDGECRNVKWRDYRTDIEKDETEFVYLKVTGKTDTREVVAMPYIKPSFDLLSVRDKYTSEDDYIFVNKNGQKLNI